MQAQLQKAWELSLLALTLWREARGQPREAIVAVACSVMNRVARPAWWGRSVWQVLTKAWQYSSLTDPKDRQLAVWPKDLDQSFAVCLEVAAAALDGRLENPVPGADSYHDTSISPPLWTVKARCVAQLGELVFYDVDHDFERAALVDAG